MNDRGPTRLIGMCSGAATRRGSLHFGFDSRFGPGSGLGFVSDFGSSLGWRSEMDLNLGFATGLNSSLS